MATSPSNMKPMGMLNSNMNQWNNVMYSQAKRNAKGKVVKIRLGMCGVCVSNDSTMSFIRD